MVAACDVKGESGEDGAGYGRPHLREEKNAVDAGEGLSPEELTPEGVCRRGGSSVRRSVKHDEDHGLPESVNIEEDDESDRHESVAKGEHVTLVENVRQPPEAQPAGNADQGIDAQDGRR